jgi:DNA-binding LytR/AlgR family response regulator
VIECIEAFAPVCDILLQYRFFIRTHRSYVVNINYIDNIGNSSILLQNQTSVPIAQGKAREIKDRYLALLMEEE